MHLKREMNLPLPLPKVQTLPAPHHETVHNIQIKNIKIKFKLKNIKLINSLDVKCNNNYLTKVILKLISNKEKNNSCFEISVFSKTN